MKSLFELCIPRADVFDDAQQNDALDLTNLAEGSIDSKKFFEENYVTDGMKQLVDLAFQRFAGIGATGLIRLKQAMGGGKTHNMIALGLLAQHPELRRNVPAEITHGVTKPIKVVSYTGRETDIQFGIWGEIASQLGKKEQFSAFYAPLGAPAQRSWIELLKGDPVLILLDELPPYLSYLRTRTVGTDTLANVTGIALANLFNAVNKAELSNVCIVVSDLKSTYESGSELLEKSFKDLDGEISRTAVDIEPVRASSDDLYLILKKKLFCKLPSDGEIIPIATEFKDAVNKARQMLYTGVDANSIYQGICEVYPFHPCIKDLFARFKENNNFQQTRGFIRLARLMIRSLWANDGLKAKAKYLINAYDYDLKDNLTYSMITSIKPKMTNAISHDICNEGRSAAEEIDRSDNSEDMQEIARMILTASLGDVTGVILGLTKAEIIGNMVLPNRDMSNFKDLIEQFFSKAWYLYKDKADRLFFRDIQNVNAKLNTLVSSFNGEQAKQEIKKILLERFAPKNRDCYQKLLVFPALDEIQLTRDAVTLILFEPNPAGGLTEDLKSFLSEERFINRVMFLSGQHDTMNNLLEVAKQQKAIQSIIEDLKRERIPESDSQFTAAIELADRIANIVNSAIKETFVTLFYPSREDRRTGSAFRSKEITMNFENNSFVAEEQIHRLLEDTVHKYLPPEKTKDDSFRKKVEERLFTARKMRWADIVERAATIAEWNWYLPSTLNDVKARAIANGYWVEEGDMVDKEPPVPKTSVNVKEVSRSLMDNKVTLRLKPENGDEIHWEVDQDATASSSLVKDNSAFITDEVVVSFVCVDSTGKHETGDPVKWINPVTVQYRYFDQGDRKCCELRANNPKVQIKYTTEGSDPRKGGNYNEPFVIEPHASLLQAVAYYSKGDIYGEVLKAPVPKYKNKDGESVIDISLPDDEPVTIRIRLTFDDNKAVYDFLAAMKKFNLTAGVESFLVEAAADKRNYIDLSSAGNEWDAALCESTLAHIRDVIMKGINTTVHLTVEEIHFPTGKIFKQWVASRKEEIKDYIGAIK